MVQNGNEVYPGGILAKIPRATTKMKDITGGLPRVVEVEKIQEVYLRSRLPSTTSTSKSSAVRCCAPCA
jgi:hypothetical protein